MKGVIMLFLVVIILISGAGCESVDTEDQINLQKQIDDLKNEIDDLRGEVGVLKQVKEETKEIEEEPEIVDTGLDLSAWSADDILDKFKETDFVFARGGWYTYEYSDKNYYSKFTQQFYGEDEFYDLKFRSLDREVNISHLRIFKLGLSKDSDNEYQDYANLIGAKSSKDSGLQCVNRIDCRDVKVIECIKSGKKFFAWKADSWLFTARDSGYALEIFKKFYC